jgi:hypothetical protein
MSRDTDAFTDLAKSKPNAGNEICADGCGMQPVDAI